MKKLIAFIAAFALVLTGCGGGSSSKEDTKVKLTIAVEESYQEYFKAAVEAFNKDKNYEIKLEAVGMFDVIDALPTQKGNGPDIFMAPVDRVGDLANQKLIAPISTKIEGYTDNATEAGKYDGKSYMVPMSTDTTLLVYNADKVTSVPKTLKEIDAKKWGAQFTNFYHAAGMFASNGAYIFKDGDTSNIGLNSPEAKKAGEAIQSLYNSGAAHWELMKDDTTAEQVMLDALYAGEIDYVITGPWKLADIEKAGIKAGAAPIPSWDGTNDFQSLVGTKGMLVNGYSKYTKEAEEFVSFLANGEWANKWHEMTKEVSPHKDVKYEAGSVYETVFKATEQGQSMPNNPEFGKVWTPMADALKQIAAKEDVQKSLDAAVTAIKAAIADMK